MKFHLLKETIEFKHALAFSKYVISGASSVIVQFGILIFLIEILKVNETISAAAGFLLGCVVNYLMLYYWTFRANGSHYVVSAKYTFVMLITLILNTAIFWLLTSPFQIPYIYSQSITTVIIGILNFIINQRYTFFSPPVIEIEEDESG